MSSGPRAIPSSINSWSPEYLESQYERFKQDPESLPPDLRAFFQGFDLALATPAGAKPVADGATGFQTAVDGLVWMYRELGHMAAGLDPFGRRRPRPQALSLAYHGLSQADLDRPVTSGDIATAPGTTLRQLVDRLERTYCGPVGAEFMHIQNTDERQWLIDTFEKHDGRIPLDKPYRAHILEQLTRAETFEKFIGKRYPGEKRFSLEGAESLIPMLDHLIERSSELGVEEMVLGMAHRGRLNVLNNILGKTPEQIFTEFEDNFEYGEADGGGDVKYHKGYSGERKLRNGKSVHLAMSSNPSHLEAVDGVVEGRTRAKQRLRGDTERRRVIPVLIHGDAAFIAQGAVAEVFNLSQLEGYTTGGTVHIVVNNLIGFTTTPEDARSTRYCTDIAKMIEAPVFHVNGEDPEAVVAVARFAIEYRQKFRKDVVIDQYCFRRYGHNEGDEPSFTQPILSSLISKKASVLKVYAERLLAEGVISETDMTAIGTRLDEALNRAQEAAKKTPFDPRIDPGSQRWAGMGRTFSHEPAPTAVSMEVLTEVCAALGRVPDGFKVNPKLKALLKGRAELPTTGQISYADAESLAFGTLLLEGTAVRLSGQDCRRGTFTHRHAVLRDFETGDPYIPLNNIREVGQPGTDKPIGDKGADGKPRQARFCVYDSPLSEEAVMAFDYGYSLADPNMLVMWEAQFGDFNNGAQAIIDQFIASADYKWDRWSGLVLLLPHGYEGAGPEHSSGRMERFLQLCGNDNMQVVYPTTAAQCFHMLRRQVRRNFRKPLIVMTPKSMLRTVTGNIQELVSGRFQEVIDDAAIVAGARKGVKRVVLCTGKVYYELAERRDALGRSDIAIVRVEQLYPLHTEALRSVLASYPSAAEKVWAQEEPRNMGAFLYMADALRDQLGLDKLIYIGRDASASPAVGSKHRHKDEQESIIERAIGPKPKAAKVPDSGASQAVAALPIPPKPAPSLAKTK
jgi:2-oxoglutarate dehydrogenase E1 component